MSYGMQGDKLPRGHEMGQIQKFTPEQMQLFKQLFSHVGQGSYLSRLAGGDQSMFEQMEAPAMRQFQGLQGDIASRFSGMYPGAMSARRGSGFGMEMSQATANFAQDLASKRMELQRQALMDMMTNSQMLMNLRPYERFMIEKEQKGGGWGSIIGGALGTGVGAMMGGVGAPIGGAIGSKLGGMFGS